MTLFEMEDKINEFDNMNFLKREFWRFKIQSELRKAGFGERHPFAKNVLNVFLFSIQMAIFFVIFIFFELVIVFLLISM